MSNDTELQAVENVETDEQRAERERAEQEQRDWMNARAKRQTAVLFETVNTLKQNKKYSGYDIVDMAGGSFAATATLEDGETAIEIQVRVRKKGESRY